MTFAENDTHLVAELTIGKNTAKVDLSEITMESCIARVTYIVRPYQYGVLKIHSYQQGEIVSSFKAVKVVVEMIRQRTSDGSSSLIKLKFTDVVSASHGIVQLLHSTKPEPE
ncbi:MAG: hypothetical protein OEM38_07705 [Gammaproteobacteria bacterium]|nr:hypothetical protein [Gammaproteobacteria bacterium]